MTKRASWIAWAAVTTTSAYKVRLRLQDGTGVLLYVAHPDPVNEPTMIVDATTPVERIDVVAVDDLHLDSVAESAGGFKAWLSGAIPDGGDGVTLRGDDI